MTRKGEETVFWTTSEISYLRDNADKATLQELAVNLNRTEKAVANQASRLGISIRYNKTVLVWCDHCATWRTEVDGSGACPVCQLKTRLKWHQEARAARLRQFNETSTEFEERQAVLEQEAEEKSLIREINKIKQQNHRLRSRSHGREDRL